MYQFEKHIRAREIARQVELLQEELDLDLSTGSILWRLKRISDLAENFRSGLIEELNQATAE